MMLILFLFHLLPRLAYAATPPAQFSARDLLTHEVKTVTLSQATRGTVVVFLSSHCPCSASHEASLKDLFKEYSTQGFSFVGVHSNQDESISSATAHFKRAELPFPILQDDGAKLANAFGAIKTPHVYVLSPGGELLFQGGVDDSHVAQEASKLYLKTALTQIAQGKHPDPAEVRVVGCVIQR